MSRYAKLFAATQAQGRIALGAFLMLGDPGRTESLAAIDALMEGGADMLELGIPFTDPVADGPVVQEAAARALAAGIRPGDAIAMLGEIRARYPDVPIGVLTYANIIAVRGWETMLGELAAAGVDSLLIADVPSIEGAAYAAKAYAAGIDPVFIAAPSTPASALATIAQLSRGYVYCVARPGVTGTDKGFALDHDGLLTTLQAQHAPPPVLGFGIAAPEHIAAAKAVGFAGAISGTALVRAQQKGLGVLRETVAGFARMT